jgi:hypothetical protein
MNKLKPSFYFSIIVFLSMLLSFAALGQQTFNASGTVTDSATGEPLAAANIRILGTTKGTITNAYGEYTLTWQRSTADISTQTLPALVVSYLAYQAETLRVDPSTTVYNARLKSSPVQIPEVLVLAEDPALEIIRKAIANKRKWMNQLTTYRFDAFTRQVLWRDTSIASITESYTTGYWKFGDTLREIVTQKRQTENIEAGDNAAAVRRMVNFNEDEIVLFSVNINRNPAAYKFVGPTAPDALEHYDYKLLSTAMMNDVEVYKIQMTPKTRIAPLFSGTIMIADETFAVMGVDLKPNETLTMPFIRNIDLRYRQQFSLYNNMFWMPIDIRIDGGFSVSFVGFSLPRIGVQQTSSIYDYELNVDVPDSIIQKRRVTTDSSAIVFDSEFWKTHEVLPLTPQEQQAYSSIDSTQTLEEQFKPKGPLGSLGGDGASSFLSYGDAHFNRVEGFYLGVHGKSDKLIPQTSLYGEAGVGFTDNLFKYIAGATVFASSTRTLGAGLEAYRRLQPTPDGGYYGTLMNSLTSLIDKNDYMDYYYTIGWRSYITAQPTRRLSATASFIHERHYTAFSNTNYSLFYGNQPYRFNPAIQDGELRSIRFDLRIGPEAETLDLVSRNALEVSVEHSSPSIAQSDFDFTRYQGLLTASIKTFSQNLLFPPALRVQVSGGTSRGHLPAQKIFTIDSRSSGYAPFGVLRGSRVKEFGGDKYIMINIEHNFRSIPFLLLDIPFLYRNSIELLLHTSAAKAWVGNVSTTDGWYNEAGIGFGRIFDILRADLTWRFDEPKRFYFSVSVVTLL